MAMRGGRDLNRGFGLVENWDLNVLLFHMFLFVEQRFLFHAWRDKHIDFTLLLLRLYKKMATMFETSIPKDIDKLPWEAKGSIFLRGFWDWGICEPKKSYDPDGRGIFCWFFFLFFV